MLSLEQRLKVNAQETIRDYLKNAGFEAVDEIPEDRIGAFTAEQMDRLTPAQVEELTDLLCNNDESTRQKDIAWVEKNIKPLVQHWHGVIALKDDLWHVRLENVNSTKIPVDDLETLVGVLRTYADLYNVICHKPLDARAEELLAQLA